jgi:hypothetical protein
MVITTILIAVYFVVGWIIAGFLSEIGLGGVGKGDSMCEYWVLLTVAIAIAITPFLLYTAFRWPLTHVAVSLIPAECIFLYMVGLFYGFFYSYTYETFFLLNMFLLLPSVIGIWLASVFRHRKKKTANQRLEATPSSHGS